MLCTLSEELELVGLERNLFPETIWHIFLRSLYGFDTFLNTTLKDPFPFRAICMCYHKQCLLLPESSLLHASTFPIILSNSFLLCQFQTSVNRTPKEQMYWRNASICYLLQFGSGICPMGFSAKRLIGFPRNFHEKENWGKSLLLDPEVRDTGLKFHSSGHVKKSPRITETVVFPIHLIIQCEKLQMKLNFFSVNRMCMITAVHIFILMKGCTFNCKIY